MAVYILLKFINFGVLVDMETTMVCVEDNEACHVQGQQGKSFGSVEKTSPDNPINPSLGIQIIAYH